ncbi:U-box domain-containing protein [Thalictrum thalictroides]|uniref:RING-type E3 ubiquitin transferase n=1 Tax=Thalictrum thalictroides TaxID=46969 RepID=A0A7J6WXF2_THATH|nr:U-box domain-containing protein [Thalictrum thalictroides]
MTGGTVNVAKALSYSCGVKTHNLMCMELKKIVDHITQIFPAIESAQPRCRSGIDALCSLNLELEKAKLLIQHCTESSKLYLVITGDAIKLRCERVRNAFEQCLSEIHSMVPLLLAAQISAIVDDLKAANFIMESSEEEAGKVILHLLRNASDSAESFEYEAFQTAALILQLTSSKALLIEKRSIKKLLDKVRDTDQTKERILKYLLYLLRKYGKSTGDSEFVNSNVKGENPNISTVSSGANVTSPQFSEPDIDVGSLQYGVQNDVSCKMIPPDEFRCPISLRLIYDPVVIASGQTFERVWIEKWFKDGHDTCPKTQKKLPHLSITPNSSMKDLIARWCRKHGISIPDPSSQPIPAEGYQRKISSSNSIESIGSSLNGVPIRDYDSSFTFGSRDVSPVKSQMVIDSFNTVSPQIDGSCDTCQSFLKSGHGINSSFLSELGELPWEAQCKVIEDIRNHFEEHEEACHSVLSTCFIQSLLSFFKDACDRFDVKALRDGAQVILTCVTKSRNEVPSLCEDVFYLLVSFLDCEISKEALAIIEVISVDTCCNLEVVASGVLPSILKILESQNSEIQIPAVKILHNLSSQSDIVGTQMVHLGYVPKLISLLGDKSLAPHCIRILKSLCITKEGRLVVGEADEFIASIVKLLETGSHEEQEHGVAILLSLCSHRLEYCHMVSKEGAISSLVSISINGNSSGKVIAMELLCLLRDVGFSNSVSSTTAAVSSSEISIESGRCSMEEKSITKAPGFFKRKIKFFSKPKSLALY